MDKNTLERIVIKMANIKPIALANGHLSNEEKQARINAEEKLKGSTIISKTPPKDLSKNGKKAYKNILAILPEGFLNGGDYYTVGVVAEAIDKMNQAQINLNTNGLLIDEYTVVDGEKVFVGTTENDAAKTYERYSKIFDKFGSKIGLSPKDRAALTIINLNNNDIRNDELLNILTQG